MKSLQINNMFFYSSQSSGALVPFLTTTRGLVRVGCGVSTAVLGVVVVFWVWGGVWGRQKPETVNLGPPSGAPLSGFRQPRPGPPPPGY